ncbi:hypothetical protein TNCV_3449381 [Trichonephila clavipes]|nr:hypothetical protein TNCV_3449381 [Trichonephila clavipes]
MRITDINPCRPSTFPGSWYHFLVQRLIGGYQSPQRISGGAMGHQFLFMDDDSPAHRIVTVEELLNSEDTEWKGCKGFVI